MELDLILCQMFMRDNCIVSTESSTPRSRHTKKAPVIGRVPSHSTGRKEEIRAATRKEGTRASSRKEKTRTMDPKDDKRVTISRNLTPLEEVLTTNLGTTDSVTPTGKDVGAVDGWGLSVFLTQDEGG